MMQMGMSQNSFNGELGFRPDAGMGRNMLPQCNFPDERQEMQRGDGMMWGKGNANGYPNAFAADMGGCPGGKGKGMHNQQMTGQPGLAKMRGAGGMLGMQGIAQLLPAGVSEQQATPPPAWGDTTTIMMRNLPNKYTQRMLLTEVNQMGFLGTFDFLYLPIDPETSANRGYAFFNFIDSSFAWLFKMSYEGRKMNRFNSNKVISVMAATLQGFDANYTHYSAARVNRGDPAARPLFLREPTQPLLKAVGQDKKKGGKLKSNTGPKQQTAVATPVMTAAPDAVKPPYVSAGDSSQSSAPKFCANCGAAIQEHFQFCPACGANTDFSKFGSNLVTER